jgi:hypothetical protein
MDPLELSHWIGTIFDLIAYSDPEDSESRAFFKLWFKALTWHRERREYEVSVGVVDPS